MSDRLVVISIAALLALSTIYIVAIIWAARFKPPTQLALILGVIGSIALGGYIGFGDQRSELIALASTCVGALASALTLTYREYHYEQNGKHTDEVTKPPVEQPPVAPPPEEMI